MRPATVKSSATVDEKRQQADQSRRAFDSAADRQLPEWPVRDPRCLERDREVDVGGIAHAQVEPMAIRIARERHSREPEFNAAFGAARGVVGERGAPDLRAQVGGPGLAREARCARVGDEDAAVARLARRPLVERLEREFIRRNPG